MGEATQADSFLLLPGDGLILILSSGRVCHIDKSGRGRLGADANVIDGSMVGESWPELADVLADPVSWPDRASPVDRDVLRGTESIRVRLFRTDDGVGVGLLGDAHERTAGSSTLLLYERMLASVTDSVLVTTAEPFDSPGPVIVFANETLLHHTGYAVNEILGRSPRMLQGPGTDPVHHAEFHAAFDSWAPMRIEMLNYTKSGEEFWVEIDMAAMADETGWFTHWVSVQRDVTARRAAAEALVAGARRDELTGIPNRRALHELASAALRRLDRHSGSVTLLFCDLDRFKEVNDGLGHGIGDLLLIEVAERLRSVLRPEDTVARLGGDEFVIMAEGMHDPGEVARLAARLRERLGEPWICAGETFHPQMSVGVATTSDPSVTVDELLRRSDLAMYQAKDAGRDQTAVYERGIDEAVQSAIAIQHQLRQAIDTEGLVLEYQPLVRLADDSFVAAEALVRLRGRDGRLILPDQFVPQAESSGLVVPMGAWVIREALAALRSWQDAGRGLRMAVNISPAQLRTAGFAGFLVGQAEQFGVDPSLLSVEVTETVLLQDPKRKAAELRALSQAGVSISLDDFGTGYSSLAWLADFPISEIKIDRTFTADIGIDDRKTAIVSALIQVAHELGLTVVAEGIETVQQRERLLDLSCDLGQGYLFGRPCWVGDPIWDQAYSSS